MTVAYLHVGMDKTGSTSLQNFLHEASGPLLEQGYLYPTVVDPVCGTIRQHGVLSSLLVAEDDLDEDVLRRFGGNERAFFFAFDWIRRTAEVSRGSGYKLILSSEAFYSLPFHGLVNLRKLLQQMGYSNIVVLIYIDTAANRYRGQTAQLIVSGRAIRAPHTQDVAHYVRRLGSVFGRNSLKVVDFRAACRNGGTVESSLDIMGIRRPEMVVETRENVSLSAEALHLIHSRYAATASLPASVLADLRTRAALLDLLIQDRRPLTLKEEVSSAVDFASTDYHWLAEEYGFAVDKAPGLSPRPLVQCTTVPGLFEFDAARYGVMNDALAQSFQDQIT